MRLYIHPYFLTNLFPQMYNYQRNNRYFAQVAGSMEALGAAELEALGATRVEPHYRGVYFDATPEALYRINYTSRLATRVLAPLVRFDCPDDHALYREAKKIRWIDFMRVEDTFAIFANVHKSRINHSQFASLRLKDAIVDAWREVTGMRPSVKRETPDVWFQLYIENDVATISLDMSGGSLHRRGYRQDAGEAPMQETVAAAMIAMSDWDGKTKLYDPFCGSGTILAEALMHASHLPSGYLRKNFGFMHLPDFDLNTWQKVKHECDTSITSLPADLLHGSDQSLRMVRIAKDNLAQLPLGRMIDVQKRDFRDVSPPEGSTILCNPPFGVRMGDIPDMIKLYEALGDWLKQQCKGSTAFIYCGNRELLSHFRLKPTFKKPLVNGALDGRLVKFEMY